MNNPASNFGATPAGGVYEGKPHGSTQVDSLADVRRRLLSGRAQDPEIWAADVSFLLAYADERLRVNVGLLDENTELKRILGPQWKDKLQQARATQKENQDHV